MLVDHRLPLAPALKAPQLYTTRRDVYGLAWVMHHCVRDTIVRSGDWLVLAGWSLLAVWHGLGACR